MFGYIKPYKPNMKIKEFEAYKGVYCGLCKQLGNDYGITSRFILNYDCTFYAVLGMGLESNKLGFKQKRCTFNPLKKCNFCTGDNTQLKNSAAISVITFYYKLIDDVQDSSFFKKIPYKFLLLFAKRYRKKALKEFKHIDDILKEMTFCQREIEKNDMCSIDKASEPTAIMLKSLMSLLATDEKEAKVYEQFGYYLGKWVYQIDAADDVQKDVKDNTFNPFKKIYSDLYTKNEEEYKNYINGTLNFNVSKLIEAYNLMDIVKLKPIIDNVIYEGLANLQKEVIFEKDKKDANKGV